MTLNQNIFPWLEELVGLGHPKYHGLRFSCGNKSGYKPIKSSITQKQLHRHIRGGENDCLAIQLNAPDKEESVSDCNMTRCLVFDFDNHYLNERDREFTIAASKIRVAVVCAVLDQNKIPFFVALSGSGVGYHIWVLFASAKRNDVVREFGKKIIEAASDSMKHTAWPKERFVAKSGAGGMFDGDKKSYVHHVELLPKGKGQQFAALPLGRKSRMLKYVADDHFGYLIDHPSLAEIELKYVQKLAPGRKRSSESSQVDQDAAFDALAATYDPANYDDWIKMAMRLIAAFGADNQWAEKRWWAWSEPHSKSARDREKWRQCRNTRLAQVTFWLDARKAGYNGKFPFRPAEERRQSVLSLISDVNLLRDQEEVAYAQLGPRKFVPVESNTFKREMWRRSSAVNSTVPETKDIEALTTAACAYADTEPTERIHLRFGALGDKRYIFLADDPCTVVEIDSTGWRICEDPPIPFRKGDGLSLPMPKEGNIGDLLDFFNIDRENMVFVLAWMMNALYCPAQQSPILLLDGPAGSCKSSALAAITGILDPKVGAQAGPPKSEDDLLVSAYGGAIVSFDNASTLARLSDALCRLSTGGGLRKRALYTNFGVAAMSAKRPVIVAGIDPTIYAQDLIERIIRVELHRPNTYMDDATFEAYVDAHRPTLIGAMLNLLSKVMNKMPDVEAVGKFRFGSYTRLGECVAQILEFDAGWFVEEYQQRQNDLSIEAADADSVVTFIRRLMANLGTGVTRYEARACKLWEEMCEELNQGHLIVSREDVPKNARAMSSRINRAKHTLEEQFGIRIYRGSQKSFIFEVDCETELTIDDLTPGLPKPF